MKGSKIVSYLLIVIALCLILAACGDSGPEADFDVTGNWVEQNGNSTLEFTSEGGYSLGFDPGLSDGTTQFSGESYQRVDNGHINFTMVMGSGTLEIIDVEASINSDHVLKFKLDGKTYTFEKAN